MFVLSLQFLRVLAFETFHVPIFTSNVDVKMGERTQWEKDKISKSPLVSLKAHLANNVKGQGREDIIDGLNENRSSHIPWQNASSLNCLF